MTNTLSIDTAEPDVEALFTWWAGLDMPHTKGTSRADWTATAHRDAVCFTHEEMPSEGFLVRANTVMHFGFNEDSLETAYEMLPEPRGKDESTSIVSRHHRR